MNNIKVHLHYLSRNLRRLARTINPIRSLNLKVFNCQNYFKNYLFYGESTQRSQSDANASIPVEAASPQKDKGKGRKKRAPAKQRPIVQVSEDAEFLGERDDAGMHRTDADFTCLATAWVTTSVNVNGRTKGFTFYQKVNIAFIRDPECPTRRSCGLTKSQWYALNAQCVAYKGIVAQERFRNSGRKTEEDRENGTHKIYKGLNGDNDFKHREAYKILAREPRWANLRDDGLNHAVNIPRNVAGEYRTILLRGTRLIGQKLHRKNILSQKALEGVTASGSVVHALLDELRLEKMQANQEKERRRA
ncbi:hypothetical protein GIB67_030482 [Kingdonia uniflora]|uniref:Uncharacterized protein n=1 Tax=Kingdonia uniflora TaxID=39325 RepID=A0A7J7P7Z3_9MAGN|nr:hypothetical protein GIB67_030482 [Kingdonia uniflora]